MPEIRHVKSPLPHGIERLPESTPLGFVITNVTLENGIVITSSTEESDQDSMEP